MYHPNSGFPIRPDGDDLLTALHNATRFAETIGPCLPPGASLYVAIVGIPASPGRVAWTGKQAEISIHVNGIDRARRWVYDWVEDEKHAGVKVTREYGGEGRTWFKWHDADFDVNVCVHVDSADVA